MPIQIVGDEIIDIETIVQDSPPRPNSTDENAIVKHEDIRSKSKIKMTEIQRSMSRYLGYFPPMMERDTLNGIRGSLIKHCVIARSIMYYNGLKDISSLVTDVAPKVFPVWAISHIQAINAFIKDSEKSIIFAIYERIYPTKVLFTEVKEISMKENLNGYTPEGCTTTTCMDLFTYICVRLLGNIVDPKLFGPALRSMLSDLGITSNSNQDVPSDHYQSFLTFDVAERSPYLAVILTMVRAGLMSKGYITHTTSTTTATTRIKPEITHIQEEEEDNTPACYI